MADRNIATNVHFTPLPMFTAYKNLGYSIGDYPNAYAQYANEITLPMYSTLSREDAEYVVENLIDVVEKLKIILKGGLYMKVKFYSPQREYHEKKEEFNSAISKVIESGNFILGDEVSNLEESIKKYTGAKYAIGVASGTDALVIASDILGFKDGKEVITSPFTFLASASCLSKHNAKPVFVDVDEESFSLDANKIEEKITDKTVGILPIHLFSQMCNMDKIMSIAKFHNLRVLEDAAEAFGMRWKGTGSLYKHSGTVGDMGVFSFFPTKTLGAYGDAGMIVTNDDELGKLAKMFRVHGASKKLSL